MYQIEQKRKNNKEFLNFLYKNSVFTISQAGKVLELTYPTTKRIIDDFLKEKIVIQKENIPNSLGRSSASFSLNKERLYSIGIQLELKKMSFILIDIYGNVLKENTVLNVVYDNETFEKTLYEMFFNFYQGIEKEVRNNILGIGISFPGIVHSSGTKILNAVNLNLENIEIKDILKEFNENIYLENDANACVYSEKILGVAKKNENFVVISIGSGIGAGIFIDSKLQKGSQRLSGEFGHISIDYLGKHCKCGNKGCWELYVSENAIMKQLEKVDNKSLENLFDKIKNPVFVNKYIKIFSIGLKNIIFALDINNIVISGNISKYIEKYKDDIEKNIKENMFLSDYNINLIFSDLNNRSSILGAALIPVSQYFNLVVSDI